MPRVKPDLTEIKSNRFVTDKDGTTRLVETRERKRTFLNERLLDGVQTTSISWRCDICSVFITEYAILDGERLGFDCGCAKMKVKRILADEFWRPGLHNKSDLEKAITLKRLWAREKRRRMLNRFLTLFSRR